MQRLLLADPSDGRSGRGPSAGSKWDTWQVPMEWGQAMAVGVTEAWAPIGEPTFGGREFHGRHVAVTA